MTKQRILRIPIYLTLIALLTGFLIYANGYRFTLDQLISDLDQSLHLGPSYIVHQQVYKDQAIVISQHDDWLVCRLVKRSVGFLWHDTGLSYRPINLKDDLHHESYGQIVADYADKCNTLGDQTIILDQIYRDLDHHRDQFLDQLETQGLSITEEVRHTIDQNNQMILDQRFSVDPFIIDFYTTKYGSPLSIQISSLNDSFETDPFQSVIKALGSNKLIGWIFSPSVITNTLEHQQFNEDWAEEDSTIKIEYVAKTKSVIITRKDQP